jgi:hypothetical protein
MDARAVYDRIDLPDVHSDWVGVIWTDPARGFAVQTLRRDFMESADFEVAGYAAVTTGVLLPSVPLAGPVGAYTAVQTNQHHFLAGRRSWVLGKASEFDSNPPELKDANSLMVLETAAIERFSLRLRQGHLHYLDPSAAEFRPAELLPPGEDPPRLANHWTLYQCQRETVRGPDDLPKRNDRPAQASSAPVAPIGPPARLADVS